MATQTDARSDVLTGGWIRYESSALPYPIFVRFEVRGPDKRLVAAELHLGERGARVDASDLRKVPMGSIVAIANHPDVAPSLISLMDSGDPGVWPPASAIEANVSILEVVDYRIAGFNVPDRKPYPDDFYRQVATHYQRLITETQRPAVVLAHAADVPVSTVHAWIKRARDRGFLPEGRKGTRG